MYFKNIIWLSEVSVLTIPLFYFGFLHMTSETLQVS